MDDVFLSYASEDRERAELLQATLESAGFTVWRDHREIDGGEPYRERIEKALANTRSSVVLWSAVSIKSDWVIGEAEESKDRGHLIQATIDPGIKPPIDFRARNTVDLTDWHGGSEHAELQRLLRSVRARVDRWHEREKRRQIEAETREILEKAQTQAVDESELPGESTIRMLSTTLREKVELLRQRILGRMGASGPKLGADSKRDQEKGRGGDPQPEPIGDPLPTLARYLAWGFSLPFALLLALHAAYRMAGG